MEERQTGRFMMWTIICNRNMHCYRQTTRTLVQSASEVLQAALCMSLQYSLTFLHYPSSSSAFICTRSAFLSLSPLTSKSSLLLLWQHNPDFCHIFRPSRATHTQAEHTYMEHHTGKSNLIKHTHPQTLFCRRGFLPTQGQSGDTSSWAKWSKSGKQRRRREERGRDGWSGTTEQYGGGWVELYASEVTGTVRQISGAWNRLWETWGNRQRAGGGELGAGRLCVAWWWKGNQKRLCKFWVIFS